jgi:RsmE family RNA methyltransferase
VLAIGSERGWTPAELDLLAARGFSFASLGDRILKTETAAVTAVAIALSKLGYV